MKTQDAPPPPPPSSSSGKSVRRATPVEQALVDRFRAALAGKGETQQQTEGITEEEVVAPLPDHETREQQASSSPDQAVHYDTRDSGAMDMDTLPPITVGALAATSPGQVAAAATATGSAGPAYNAAAVAQLLEKHVRQLLVSESRSARGDTPQVMLNLTDAVLPGTQLTLTQTEGGWQLASSSTSTDSYRVIRDLAPQLQERFSERGLGELDLQVTLAEDSHD
ncbi:MAG: type III secretion HpaP family protein [Gammaproteobacteria bacterium]